MWYQIKDFENYEVNEYGQVRNTKTKKILKKRKDNNLYVCYRLYKNGKPHDKRVHRLMMENIKPVKNMENLVVNHIDGDKTNCLISNLEWVTVLENAQHASKIGLLLKGEEHPQSKIKEVDAIRIKKLFESGLSNSDIVKTNPDLYTKSIVEKITSGERWKHLVTCND